MRKHRILLTALVFATLLPAMAHAQETRVYRFTQRGMLGVLTEAVPAGSMDARRRLVVDVVRASPADRAGLMKGDTIVRINGLAATSQVMSAPFEPGDTVVLRVKRGAREMDVTVVASERSHQFESLMQDSIGRRMSVIIESMRGHADSILPRMTIRRFGNDSTTAIIIGTDTVTVFGRGGPWSGRMISPDSIRGFFLNVDSLRAFADSTGFRFRTLPDGVSVWADSLHFGEGGVYRFFGDTIDINRPFEMMRAGTLLGMRAVGGAELSDLNEGLGEYFGTSSGVLVMNARSGTPAERAGLRAGDVIIRVNDEPVRNIVELRRRIDEARGGNVSLRVLRRGQNVDVTLPR